ncbi:uncharacterized protein LOC114241748 [Bombyx mandarina]|uniref:Uncharacterized protein LOC114241748 n=1 Tax=Bombyx mandarina TaxID=7092 RepID=A0A6J2JHK8_BOMMA|nr:uncharacterized protein LOC114241748 [Bombyx mandarina]
MIKYLFLCTILFASLVSCINVTTVDTQHEKVKPSLNTSKENISKDSKVNILSEGGALLSETRTLPKDTLIDLMSLEEGITKQKEKPIHPRKGVGNYTIINSTNLQNISTTGNIANTTVLNSTEKLSSENVISDSKIPISASSEAGIHKKPTLLSSDKMDNDANAQEKLTERKTMILPDKMTQSKTVTKHPGMVIPVVITILVVPMFAVLGYLALKRGQEAWKNRHYKRMDFLLDGMYND